MFENIRALIAFEKTGTLSEAAVRLRLTQSAITKRIQSLEAELGYKLVKADGRKLKLTEKAEMLLAKAKPLISEIDSLKSIGSEESHRTISIGVSDSIASTWGPLLIFNVLKKNKTINFDIHVHRSTLIIEHIKLGKYDAGLITGQTNKANLIWTQIAQEQMCLISPRNNSNNTIWTIEQNSATWKEISGKVASSKELKGQELRHVESFVAAGQLAKSGFGKALLPAGVSHLFEFKSDEILNLNINRQIQFVTKKSIHNSEEIQNIQHAFTSFASKTLEKKH